MRHARLLAAAVGVNAGLAIPWWIALHVSEGFRRRFLPAAYPDAALFSYEVADAVLFIGAGLLAAAGLWLGRPWAKPVLRIHLGAAAYSSLVTLHQFVITGEAALAAVGMLPSLLLGIAVLAGQMDFRVARPSSRAWNLTKTLGQTVVMWSTALLLVPQFLVLLESRLGVPGFPPLTIAGWLVFGTASCVGLWSGWTMAWSGAGTPLPLDTARTLVIAGPYAWIRNPMALAGVSQGIGVGMVLGSPGVILYSLAGGVLWQWIARPSEEADLLARFGEPYARYREAVPCWIPRRSPYRTLLP